MPDSISVTEEPVELDGDLAVATAVVAELNRIFGGRRRVMLASVDLINHPPLPTVKFHSLRSAQAPAELLPPSGGLSYIRLNIGAGIQLPVSPPDGLATHRSWVDFFGDRVAMCGYEEHGVLGFVLFAHSITCSREE